MNRRNRFIYVGLGALAGAAGGVCLALGYYLNALTFAVIVVNTLFVPKFCHRAFQRGEQVGYVISRRDMYSSLQEATQRGMSPMDWVTAECERDGIQAVWVERDAPE